MNTNIIDGVEPDVSAPDRRAWWLTSSDRGGLRGGLIACVEIDAGYADDVVGYADVEQAILVLSGR